MDKYNHWIGKLFGEIFSPNSHAYCIVISGTAYYSCPEDEVALGFRLHENCHKIQQMRLGYVIFIAKYIYYHLKYGYEKNPLEAEADAYAAAGIEALKRV